MRVRLQKFLSEAGVASRRASEQIIVAGRVAVNGRVVKELGTRVDPVAERVTVDGQPVKVKKKLYVALHKPTGYLCTRRDPEGRRTVADLLPEEWTSVYTVGRLDKESEGLIFLTNDGDFSLRITHPRYGIRKTYRVTVEGRADLQLMRKLVEGVEEDGEKLKCERARIISSNNTQSLLELELAEGKNREVRRLMSAHQMNVLRLQRIRIGPIKLGELPLGRWRTLTESEIKSLLSRL